jgi:ureidoglycolate hydrolase
VQVRAVPLSEAAWRPFGWIPVPDTDPADGDHRLAFDWSDAHVNIISHTLDEVPQTPAGLRCEVLYRHDTHTQVLMPLDTASVLAVAPAQVTFSEPGDAGQVQAFLLDRLEAIVLHQGTWHWGPYPVGASRVSLFNVQGLRYAEDNSSIDLAAQGCPVDVLLP